MKGGESSQKSWLNNKKEKNRISRRSRDEGRARTGSSAPPVPERRTSLIPSSQAPFCPNSSICDSQLLIATIQSAWSPGTVGVEGVVVRRTRGGWDEDEATVKRRAEMGWDSYEGVFGVVSSELSVPATEGVRRGGMSRVWMGSRESMEWIESVGVEELLGCGDGGRRVKT